ncbi:MAG: hypothetical protein HYV14_05105 [Elusimicrobia bacterium]|nr:hypothetical protein [Elusimicrobiota bacterium]
MKLAFAVVLLGTSAIAVPAAKAVDRNAELVAKMKERDPEVRTMTLDVLREMNVDYQALATRRLEEDGEIFDRARIEVDGVNAKDNTANFDPSLFDEPPVQPSHSAQDRSPGVINKLRRIFGHSPAADVVLDISDYRSASNGEMTKRTRDVFDDWKTREINEVVAHSWGCEAVYAAIVNGYMLPPKKLILTGVPDNSFVKWQLLAKYTGTKVFWVRADNDTVAAELGTRIGNNKSWTGWNLDWESYCIPERPSSFCNAHGRAASTATKVSVGKLPSAGGHNREEYYAILKTKGIIAGTPLDLRRAESAKKVAEIAAVVQIAIDTAHREASQLVAQAREQRMLAKRDHDERLKNAYAELARRSCDHPGSVSQTELDALPKSYGTDAMNTLPPGLGDCSGLLYGMLLRGATADQMRAWSEREDPAPAKPESNPVRAVPFAPSDPTPIRGIPVSVFPTILSLAKDLSVTACGSPDRVTIDQALTIKLDGVAFSRHADRIADELALGLGPCESRLFRRLIEVIRNGEGPGITVRWVQETAAAYRPAPAYFPPQSGKRCEDYGNVRCPH